MDGAGGGGVDVRARARVPRSVGGPSIDNGRLEGDRAIAAVAVGWRLWQQHTSLGFCSVICERGVLVLQLSRRLLWEWRM